MSSTDKCCKTCNGVGSFIHSSRVSCCSYIPQRFVVYGLTSAACFVCFFQRQIYYQVFSDIFDDRSLQSDVTNSRCPRMISYYEPDRRIPFENFQPWKPSQVEGTTQAFFIGFIVILIPGGVMADTHGGKSIMAVGIIIATVVTILLPIMIELGPSALACNRLLQGLAQGLVYPSISAITAQWAPASERTIATGIIFSSQFFGWSTAYWVRSQFTTNWNVQFYLCAAMGLAWLIIWTLFSFSKPSYCSYIKKTELEKIKISSHSDYDRKISAKPFFIPWKEILCCYPLLSLILINWAGLLMHYTMMTHFRFYFLNVIGLTKELSNDSVEIAHFSLGVSGVIWGFVCDWMINHNYTSRTVNRRFFAFTSNILVIPILMGVLLAGCEGRVVSCLYLTINFIRGPFFTSLRSNFVDLNPHFAGTLNGIVLCTGTSIAIFTSDFYEVIVKDSSDVEQWGYLFLIFSAILLFLSLPYIWLGSGELQPWGLQKLQRQFPSAAPSSTSLRVQSFLYEEV